MRAGAESGALVGSIVAAHACGGVRVNIPAITARDASSSVWTKASNVFTEESISLLLLWRRDDVLFWRENQFVMRAAWVEREGEQLQSMMQ